MKRKLSIIAAAVCMLILIAVLGTYAYLSQSITPITNQFVFSADTKVSGELKEVLWDGVDFGETYNAADPRYDPSDNNYEKDLGMNMAKQTLPGMTIPKNPTMKNTSDTEVWAAIKLHFKIESADSSYADIKAIIQDITFGGDWEIKVDDDNKCVYAYYKEKIPKDAVTKSALFSEIEVKGDLTNDTMKSFEIIVNGYVVQGEGFANCQTAMNTVFTASGFPAPTLP